MKQSTFLNTQNWYCVEPTCFWISSFGSASSNAVRISYTATHTQLFCNISLHGTRTVSNYDHFILQFQANLICCLHLLGYHKIKFRLSSASRQVTWVRFHWNYIFISNLSYWKAQQLVSKIVVALSEQIISQVSYFENSLFRIKQLTMLLAAQEVLYWLIHF